MKRKNYRKKWTIDLFGGPYDGERYNGYIRGKSLRFPMLIGPIEEMPLNFGLVSAVYEWT